MHHADDGLAARYQPDRHADRFETVHEVRGAVERIDEPTGLGAFAAFFFAEHGEAGLALEHLAHCLLAGDIRGGHPVAGRLLANFGRGAEVGAHDLASRARGTIGGDEECVEVECGHVRSHQAVPIKLFPSIRRRGQGSRPR